MDQKMRIGITTCCWYEEENPEESIRFLNECGFDTIDLSFTDKSADTFDKETCTTFFDKSIEELIDFYTPLKKAMEKNGMKFSQAHGCEPTCRTLEPEKSACFLRALIKQIEICQYLECPLIVFHLWTGFDVTKDEEIEWNLNVCRKLIPVAKRCGVKICLENIYKHLGIYCAEGACSNAKETVFYIDTLNEEAGEEIFGACVDTGHIHLIGKNLYQHIKTLGNRVWTVHIHENIGIEDTHMIPYTQLDAHDKSVSINWDRFLRALNEIGYRGTISFETYRGLRVFPRECWKAGLQLISSIGRYFEKRILE